MWLCFRQKGTAKKKKAAARSVLVQLFVPACIRANKCSDLFSHTHHTHGTQNIEHN